jgi:hypothetical protein
MLSDNDKSMQNDLIHDFAQVEPPLVVFLCFQPDIVQLDLFFVKCLILNCIGHLTLCNCFIRVYSLHRNERYL